MTAFLKNVWLSIAMLNVLASLGNAQVYHSPAKSDPGFLGESAYFMFYSHYWLNMHHFLYNAAQSYDEKARPSFTVVKWSELNSDERATMTAVLMFYRESKIAEQDLRTGSYNYSFKRWVVQFGAEGNFIDNKDFAAHVKHLQAMQPIYDRHYSKEHQAANRNRFESEIGMIRKYEEEFVQRLTELCRARWEPEKIRVDISYHSKRDIPYTTLRPVMHIVMQSIDNPRFEKGMWFELLLHEACHYLIHSSSGFVGGTILDAAQAMKTSSLRNLDHAYLFYFSGVVATEIMEKEGNSEYVQYMVHNKVFSAYFPFLDKHLPLYISKTITLAEATRRVLADFQSSK